MFQYFAYGSVLSLAHAREWSSSHGANVLPFLQGVPARLDGYELVFDVPSRFWSGRVATIQKAENKAVHGILFSLDESMQETVLRKEGVATGLYEEHQKTVSVGESSVLAHVYLAQEHRRQGAGPASPRYVQALQEGARERGLPAEWQHFLTTISLDSVIPAPPGISLGFKRSE